MQVVMISSFLGSIFEVINFDRNLSIRMLVVVGLFTGFGIMFMNFKRLEVSFWIGMKELFGKVVWRQNDSKIGMITRDTF